MTRQHYTEFNVGDRVRASDGTKAPPKHHNRKLADWQRRNFTATVAEVKEAGTPFPNGRPYMPNGALVLIDDRYPDGGNWIQMRFHHDLGGTVQFEKIPAGWEKAETEAA